MKLNKMFSFILRTIIVVYVSGIACVHANEMCQLRTSSTYGYHHRTSSTLMWTSSKEGQDVPEHAVPVDKNNLHIAWCRAKLNEIMIPGELDSNGKCKLAFLKATVTYDDKFDILVSVNGSSRIRLESWDSFLVKPENALQSPDRILAVVYSKKLGRHVAANIGTRDSDRQAIISEEDIVMHESKALILVEDEPTRYTLRNIYFEKRYSAESMHPILLNSSTLVNDGNETLEVVDLLPYTVKETQYWGRAKGTISALETTVERPEDGTVEILWGTVSEFKRVKFANIFYSLPPNSAVNVTLMGTIKKFETNYNGALDASYDDGFSNTRHIKSLHIDESLTMVIAKYGIPFFLNGTDLDIDETSKLVYELTTTTTKIPSTTTTTPSTTTTTTMPTIITIPPATTIDVFDSEESMSPSAMLDNEVTEWAPESLEKLEDPNSTKDKLQPPPSSKNNHHSPKPTSTSDRLLSGLATIFTALVLWYFSLGAPA